MPTDRSFDEEPIRDNELYRLPHAAKKLGMSKHAMRQARRSGLPVKRFGRNAYVLGRDVIEWMARQDREAKETPST